jgi:hypothetical protein
MPLKRLLLTLMLGLLGAAAVLGVASIFFPGSNLLARVAWTLLAAAFASGFATGLAPRMDNVRTRPFARAALTVIVAAFGLWLVAIWGTLLLGSSLDVELVVTAVLFIVYAVPALAAYGIARLPGGREGGWIGVGSVVVAWLMAMAALWDRQIGLTDPEWLVPANFVVLGFAVSAASCLFQHADATRRWPLLGAAAALVALATGLLMVTFWHQHLLAQGRYSGYSATAPPWHQPVYVLAQTFAAVVGLLNVARVVPMVRSLNWLRYICALAALVTGTVFILTAIETNWFTVPVPYLSGTLLTRVLGACSIVLACSLIALVLASIFSRKPAPAVTRAVASLAAMDATCPRCATRFSAKVGSSRCPGCGLVVELRLIEPRCAKCEYSLLDISAPNCPECGEPRP